MSPSVLDKPLLSTLRGRPSTTVPYWFMRQAGRYLPEYRALRAKTPDFLKFCYTPDLAIEATLQPVRRFSPNGAILFCDILVVPDALGVEVGFVEGTGPVLTPVRDAASIPHLDPDAFHNHLAPVYETLGRLSSDLPDDVTLIGFAGAPWTLASYMVEGGSSRDFARTKQWAYGDREGFSRLIDVLSDAVATFLVRQIEAGAQAVQLFDSWAGVLPAVEFSRWCVEPVQRIVAAVRAASPQTPVIAFPRGAGPLYAHVAQETGVQALSLDTAVPLHWACDVLPKTMVLQGNLDPQLAVVGGEAMESAARHILEVMSDRPFVFNLGHGFVPETPPENVERLATLIREWQRPETTPAPDLVRLD
jgi:uroporphyrinogen decarboxylase